MPTSIEPIVVALADRPCAADRGQRQAVVGRQAERIDGAVADQTDEQRGGAQDVDRVAGVLGVAPERDPGAAGQQLAVASGGGESLGQAQVGPRARRDRGVGAHHDVELVVVEMHGVGHQHVRAEHAQLVEVDERTATRCARDSWRHRRRAATCGT